jgi:uncharacterized cupredoxin-like copper-binding protein
MQMKKTLGILLALCFLMSVTAAAVSADQRNDNIFMQKTQVKAVDDTFKLNSKDNTGNVLRNDKGKDLKVKAVWGAKGKVTMQRDGKFTYKPFRSNDKVIKDSFKYMIIGKNGKTSIATVKIIFENKKMDNGRGNMNGKPGNMNGKPGNMNGKPGNMNGKPN